jgi:hypothetical protein
MGIMILNLEKFTVDIDGGSRLYKQSEPTYAALKFHLHCTQNLIAMRGSGT